MQDKRQYIRWAIALPIKYKIDGYNQEVSSNTKDISNGGLSVNSSNRINPGSQLDITVAMPDDIGPIIANGQTIWQAESFEPGTKSFLAGIRFTNLTYSDRDKIFRYLYKYRRKELVKRWWDST